MLIEESTRHPERLEGIKIFYLIYNKCNAIIFYAINNLTYLRENVPKAIKYEQTISYYEHDASELVYIATLHHK